jgi:hypothetical protein
MQRLVRAPDIVRSQARGHRLHALALTGQQQSRTIRFQRSATISVPCGFRQAIRVCRKALFLWAWRRRMSHKNILPRFCCF